MHPLQEFNLSTSKSNTKTLPTLDCSQTESDAWLEQSEEFSTQLHFIYSQVKSLSHHKIISAQCYVIQKARGSCSAGDYLLTANAKEAKNCEQKCHERCGCVLHLLDIKIIVFVFPAKGKGAELGSAFQQLTKGPPLSSKISQLARSLDLRLKTSSPDSPISLGGRGVFSGNSAGPLRFKPKSVELALGRS